MLKKFFYFFVSNSFNKLVLLFLLPLFTSLLAKEELGQFEIVNTLSLVLNVAITLQVHEGILKLLLNKDENKRNVLASGTLILLASLVLFNCINAIIYFAIPVNNFGVMVLFFNSQILVFFLQRIVRGLQNHLLFTIGNVINWGFIGALLPIFLIYGAPTALNMYYAFIISNFIAVLFFILFQKEIRQIRFADITAEKVKYLFNYSGPLVFDALSLWMINFADRILLGALATVAAVGIYGVANKFAATLMFFNTIFYLGWQEYALASHNRKEREKLFTDIFNNFFKGMFSVYFVLLPLSKYLLFLVIDPSYHEAWLYIPVLMSSVLFTSFASFFSLKYQVSGKTGKNFVTSLIGNIVNIVLNLILIPYYGIWGAAVATIIAFATLWIIRIPGSDGFFDAGKFNKISFGALLLIGLGSVYVYYTVKGNWLLLVTAVFSLLFVILNRNMIKDALFKIKKAAHRGTAT